MQIDKITMISEDRIGLDCYFDTLSCSLEYMDALYWALDFVHYCFLYNKNNFITFMNDSNIEDLLSNNDIYFFQKSPQSRYRSDYYQYSLELCKKRIDKKIIIENGEMDNFLIEIKEIDKKKLPISLPINPKKIKEFYKKNKFTVPRSDCYHLINIFEIDDENNLCYIFDRGFDCFGAWIDNDLLYNGVLNSGHRVNLYTYFYFSSNDLILLNADQIKELLIQNIDISMKKEIVINNSIYHVNSLALKEFRYDFEYITQLSQPIFPNKA